MPQVKKLWIDPKIIEKRFAYDEKTGQLYKRQKRGLVACSESPSLAGYLRVSFGRGIRLFQHRVIWCLVYGYWPENNVDHINRIRTDNRIENLREVSQVCNSQNSEQRTDNTTGVRGVCWFPRTCRWAVQICVNDIKYYLGYYKEFTEAVAHRLAAEQCFGWADCDINSPAFQYMQAYIKQEIG